MTYHRKRSIGAKVPASSFEYNQRLDAARWMKENYYSTPFGGQVAENKYNGKGALVWVKNDSGVDVPMFGVLGLETVLFDANENYWEFKRNFAFVGTYPSNVTHLHKYGIAVQPIPNGAIGKCMIMGVIAVQVEVTDESHEFAIPKTNDVTMLQSAKEKGSPILYKPSGEGTYECVVRIESAGEGNGGGGGEFHQLYEFTTLADLTTADLSVSANVTSAYVGPKPVTPITIYNTCQCFEAPAGSCGIGAWDAERGRHQIVYMCKPSAPMIQFTLSSVLTYDDVSAPATVVVPDGYWNSPIPGSGIETVYNTCGMFEGENGTCGVAHWNEDAQHWQIISLDQPGMIEFTLNTALGLADNTVVGTVAVPNGYWQGAAGGGTETLTNTCNRFQGPAGACGLAHWNSRRRRYEIIQLTDDKLIQFTLSSKLTRQDDTAGANVAIPDGYWYGAPGDGTEVVLNTCNMFEGEIGTCGVARWNARGQDWQIIALWETKETPVNVAEWILFNLTSDMVQEDDFVNVSVDVLTGYWNGTPGNGLETVWNTCNFFEGISGTCGVARWNSQQQRYQIIQMWRWQEDPVNVPQMIEFTLSADLGTGDASAPATVSVPNGYWNGYPGLGAETVYNTCQMFRGESGTCGVARWNSRSARYQIIQMECVSESINQGAYQSYDVVGSGIQADPPFSYAAETVVPLSTHRINVGDLLQLEPTYEFTFLRAANSAVAIEMEFAVDDQIGASDTDQTVVNLQVNIGGAGWQNTGLFALISHPYYRVPPNDYIQGGQANVRFTYPATGLTTGDKVRMTVQTRNATQMDNALVGRLDINETGYSVTP